VIATLNNAYLELTDYIHGNPEISIGIDKVKIPGDVRMQFYQLFDGVRSQTIERRLPDLVAEARLLSDNYLKIEKEVFELLGLEKISMPVGLNRFLHYPLGEFMRDGFDPLFELLKGLIDYQAFEQKVIQSVRTSYARLFASGYEKWVALSLVRLLEADSLFQYPVEELSLADWHRGKEIVNVEARSSKKSNCLLFNDNQPQSVIAPDFAVRSIPSDKFIAFRSELGNALATATNASPKREWISVDSIPDWADLDLANLTFIYVDNDPENINLAIDKRRICRPDLILECRSQKGWYNAEESGRIKLHDSIFKPRLGSYVISREPVSQAVTELKQNRGPEDKGKDPRIISAGYDCSKLEAVVDSLSIRD
jgi:hypothetical protein